jgi:ABC-type uncharacterized transport system permease subunit
VGRGTIGTPAITNAAPANSPPADPALADRNALAGILISAFFAAVSTGSLQLPLQMHLDSSISGILEGTLVLLALFMRGMQARLVPGGR